MHAKLGLAPACAIVALALSLTAAPPAASGGEDGLAVAAHLFEAADSDRSGALDAAEYEAANLARFGVSFEQSDLDGDGATSREEYLELYRRHHPVDGETDV